MSSVEVSSQTDSESRNPTGATGQSSFLDAALGLAQQLGWAVFPLARGGKTPLTEHGCKDATTDVARIIEWWTSEPRANIGIATGAASGITVLDVDVKPWHEKHGDNTLAALVAEHGALPRTPRQKTWSGGEHYVFAYAEGVGNSAGRVGEHLDIRGEGGYVVVAPSVVEEDGRSGEYAWIVSPHDVVPAPIPAWLIPKRNTAKRLNGAARTDGEWDYAKQGAPRGRRQAELPAIAGRLLNECQTVETARLALHGWVDRCEQFPDDMLTYEAADDCLDRIIALREANGETKPETKAEVETARRPLIVQAIRDVPMRPVPWLWASRLARGALSLFVGDPEDGKTVTALDLAARVSTGKPWPDGLPGGGRGEHVLVFSAEDSTAYTLRPRLEAAGADVSKIYTIGVEPGGLSFSADVVRIEDVIGAHRPVLVIVDPLSSYLPKVDTYRDNEVRATLAPFATMAERHDVAVIAIMHMTKNTERTAMQRVLGSTAFIALARTAFLVAKDPEDRGRRLFLPIKNNLGPRAEGLAFTLQGVRLPVAGGTIDTVKVVWAEAHVNVSADEILRRGARDLRPGEHAEAVFRAALAKGPVQAKTMEQVCVAEGIAPKTADRAKTRLGIQSFKTGFSSWYWSPPGWSDYQIEVWPAQAGEANIATDEDGHMEQGQ
jgi:bifunctional DNA primase/polymerase-like protein/AAA domain-containing protein